jgi:ketosteroid isomerase-like protein
MVSDLEDALSIWDCVVGYSQTYDSRDHDGLESVLAEDCQVTMQGGRFDGKTFEGRQVVLDWLEQTWPQTPPCIHFTGNFRTWTDDSGEAGSADYLFVGRQRDGTIQLTGAGRYVDRFSPEGDRWVIEERTVGMLGFPEK